MKPLFVLLITFGIAMFIVKLIRREFDPALSARIAMSAMLLFTALGHFVFTKGMSMMIPGFIPYKIEMVYITGIIEIMAAIGLLTSFRVPVAMMLILFFILLLPANVFAAIKHIDYEKGNFEGAGMNYLWFRVPLQVLFIAWTYLSSIRF